MKKLISLLFLVLLTTIAAAQVTKTIDVPTAGTLSTLLTFTEKTTSTNLTVTGNIDARDVRCLRDEMTVLAVLDISAVNIVAYNGTDGTSTDTNSYPANEMPISSFKNKATLKTITLPNSITSIGSDAFSCTGLTGNLIIPNSVTSIGNNAFLQCSLTSITLGSGVTSIGDQAFRSCTTLKIINSLNPTPPPISFLTFNGASPSIVYVPASAVDAYKAASGWSGFTIATEKRVTINNPTAGGLAITLITAGFGPLSHITHLTVTGNLNSVDIGQMNTNMTALTEIDISGATLAGNVLPANAFKDKTTLISVKLPSSLVTIGDYAFSGCIPLSDTLVLQSTLTSIGNSSFSNCMSLTGDLIIPNSVTSIGSNAFSGCIGLKGNLTLPNTLTTISDYAFQSCNGLSGTLTIPNSVTSIGLSAFNGCKGFTGSLILPNSITEVSFGAFANCSGISGILTIPLSLTSIGNNAFAQCNQLTELTISKNTTSIGEWAFSDCSGLTKISIRNSSPPTVYSNTFYGVLDTCKLKIPTGSSLLYQTANYWSKFYLLIESDVDKNIICGDSIILHGVDPKFPVGDLTYLWTPASKLNSPSIANPHCFTDTSTKYKVNVTSTSGWSDTDSIYVSVTPLTANAGPDKTIVCGGAAQFNNVTTNYTGTGKLKYKWTPATGLNNDSIANPTATVINDITYTVIVKTPNGCTANDEVSVIIIPMVKPEIGMVGVSSNNKNLIAWNKPVSAGIESYYIYRETNVTNVYDKIGSVPYDSLSIFVDNQSLPDVQSNKYKLSILDRHGLESPQSNYHKTMHLAINKGTGNAWNLSWEAYEGFVVSTYNIYRGTTPSNLALLGSTSGSNTQYNDLNAPSGDVYYQLEVISPNSVNPTKVLSLQKSKAEENGLSNLLISYNSSRSNIATNVVSGINEIGENNKIHIYPNPVKNELRIDFEGGSTFEILNIVGQVVYNGNLINKTIVQTSNLSSGVYLIKLKLGNTFEYKKIIKE